MYYIHPQPNVIVQILQLPVIFKLQVCPSPVRNYPVIIACDVWLCLCASDGFCNESCREINESG